MPYQQPHEFMRFGDGADFRHVCAECRNPRRHPIHGMKPGLEREPRRIGDSQPSANEIRACYRAVIDILDEFNEMVSEEDQMCLPIMLDNILADYIAEREAVESLTGKESL